MFNKKRKHDTDLAIALISRVGEAIASKGNKGELGGTREARQDSNPYTEQMTTYDLGRLISYLGYPRPEEKRSLNERVVADLIHVVVRTNNSSRGEDPSVELAQVRARWLKHELDALNAVVDSHEATALDSALTRVTRAK